MFEPNIPSRTPYRPVAQDYYVRNLSRRLRVVGSPNWSPAGFERLRPSPAAPPLSMPVAGAGPVPVTAVELEGAWTLRFGRFGCPDSETRGGVAHVERSRLFGGDANFAFDGFWKLRGTEVNATLLIVRHDADNLLTTLFETDENDYRADCTAEVITRDLIEGRIKRPGFPDARLTMRRLPFRPR